MITIAVVAYLAITVLFIAGLAAAASRPAPGVDKVIEPPVNNITAESKPSLEKVVQSKDLRREPATDNVRILA
jgi:hypothetical protein